MAESLPASMGALRCYRRYDAGRLRNSGLVGVCHSRGTSAPLRDLLLSRWRPRIRAFRYVASTRGRPTSAIAMLVGTTVAGMSEGDPVRWAAISALAALVVAVFAGFAWLFKLSGLVNFISRTILTGFKAGAALTIAMTQLPKLFGVPGGGDSFFERMWVLFTQLSDANVTVLLFGVAALALLLIGDQLFPDRPVALCVVALSIFILYLTNLELLGVTTIGDIPAGLPQLAWPSLKAKDVDGVIPLAAACFLLSYVESVSAARALAEKHGYEVIPRQGLLALAAANFAASFTQGFSIAGGLSQFAVNDKAGARTPLSLVFASVTIGLCLLFLTGFLYHLPTVILASIVLVAVRGLFDLAALRHLWHVSRFEFSVAMVALAGVLFLGILQGVLLAVIVSLVMLLAAVARPHVAFLGRIPGTHRFSDLSRHPENEVIPGIIIFRVESSLLYFNCEHVRDVVWAKIADAPSLRLVVCDLSNSPYVDVAGASMLKGLHAELSARNVTLRIDEAHGRGRDLLRAEGLEELVGHIGRHMSLNETIAEHVSISENV